MEDLFLTEPCKEYEVSFINYVLLYKNNKDEHYYNIYKKSLESFDEYLKELHNNSKGINVPQGWVATSTFWLIHNKEVTGVVRVRHEEVECAGHIGCDISPNYRNKGYGTIALKLALEEAKKIGIKDAIVTCNIYNAASKNIIEKNNGKLMGTVEDQEENEKLYKYCISIEN
ncbi:MAG: GCN5-related N-acetyltransferase [Clostridiaceae bacterium]|jgi:predicted acetyltransferase|nr:GCN5-related N-acetyltransferase [Clostridiaceae bacterium]